MYAVFEDGSRQYIVEEGAVVRVDFRDLEIGDTLEFGRVLLYKNDEELLIGQPILAGARVIGEVIDQPTQKFYIQHFRRRKNYRRFKGHRQPFTDVEVLFILKQGEEPEYEDGQEEVAGTEAPTA